uniref:Uncharacterized protein n=1 Tax=Parascaris univalens TaxID=6257 RepID=A0A915A397_PARUN
MFRYGIDNSRFAVGVLSNPTLRVMGAIFEFICCTLRCYVVLFLIFRCSLLKFICNCY